MYFNCLGNITTITQDVYVKLDSNGITEAAINNNKASYQQKTVVKFMGKA